MGAMIYIFFFPFSLFVSVYVYASVCDSVCIALLLPFVLGFCLPVFFSFFLSFFLPFILRHVDDRIMVLWPGVRPVPLRWESKVQDIGPPETSQLHVISNGKNLPEISNSMPRPSSTQRPASYSAGHPMPNN